MLQVREEKGKQNRNIITTRNQTLSNNKKEKKKTCSIHYMTFLAVWQTHSANVGKRF